MTNIKYLFPKHEDSIDVWSKSLIEFLSEKEKFELVIDLNGYTIVPSKMNEVIAIKSLFDILKPYTSLYLTKVILVVEDKILRKFLKGILPMFLSDVKVSVSKSYS